jgi:hypothetical protein
MKYFGYFSKTKLNKLTKREMNELLVLEGVFEVKHRINIPRDGNMVPISLNSENRLVGPTKVLTHEFYKFVLKTYNSQIDALFLDFSYHFNSEVFGLEHAEKKKIARGHYLKYTRSIRKEKIDLVREIKSSSGIDTVMNASQLELLLDKQNALKSNLAEIDSILLKQYLLGKADYFSSELIDDSDIITEIILFEAGLKILLSLNDQYKFERYDYFTSSDESNKQVDSVEVHKTEKKKPLHNNIAKAKKKPIISDTEAITYLLENVFSKNKN